MKYNIFLPRIRHSCISLNADLVQINIIPYSNTSCSVLFERAKHYFFECNLYNTQRFPVSTIFTILKDSLSAIFTTLKDSLSAIFTTPKDSLSATFTTLKDSLSAIFTTPKDSLSAIFTTPKDSLSAIFTKPKDSLSARGWSGGAKVSCILCHRGVQLILAYSWARPAILVAGKGRGGMFLFLLFLHFHSCSSFFPVPLFHLFDYLF